MAKLTACPVRPRFPSAPGSPGSPYEANKNSNRMRMAAHFGKEWWPGFNVAVEAPMGLFGVGSGEGLGVVVVADAKISELIMPCNVISRGENKSIS